LNGTKGILGILGGRKCSGIRLAIITLGVVVVVVVVVLLITTVGLTVAVGKGGTWGIGLGAALLVIIPTGIEPVIWAKGSGRPFGTTPIRSLELVVSIKLAVGTAVGSAGFGLTTGLANACAFGGDFGGVASGVPPFSSELQPTTTKASNPANAIVEILRITLSLKGISSFYSN